MVPANVASPEPYQFENAIKENLVNEYTGDMTLSLPLFTVPGRNGMDYSIGLVYSAGIKVDQPASEVGLGWSINTPSISRNVNGVPDDYNSPSGDSNIYFFKHLPATYPEQTFQQQWDAHDSAKKAAKKQMLISTATQAVMAIATAGASGLVFPGKTLEPFGVRGPWMRQMTGGEAAASNMANSALSSAASSSMGLAVASFSLNKQFKDSANELRGQQEAVKAYIDATTDQGNRAKYSPGMLFTSPYVFADDRGITPITQQDQATPDTLLVSSPSFVGTLSLEQLLGGDDKKIFVPSSTNSAVIESSAHTTPTTEVAPEDKRLTGESPTTNSYVTVADNNFILLRSSESSPLAGVRIVDPEGNRQTFTEPLEQAIKVVNGGTPAPVQGFIPTSPEIPNANYPNSYSSFSWTDFFPGGELANYPESLAGDETGRYGTAQVFTNPDYTTVWGLTSIKEANLAINGKGNQVQFEYEDVPLTDGVFTHSNTMQSLVGSSYFSIDESYSVTPYGQKVISRSYTKPRLISKVITATHYATFDYDYVNRYDGKEAFAHGATTGNWDELDGMPRLASVTLYQDYGELNTGESDGENGKQIERYVFEHDHSLAYGTPNNLKYAMDQAKGTNYCEQGDNWEDCGKLTLKSLKYGVCDAWNDASDPGRCTHWNWLPSFTFDYGQDDGRSSDEITEDLCEANLITNVQTVTQTGYWDGSDYPEYPSSGSELCEDEGYAGYFPGTWSQSHSYSSEEEADMYLLQATCYAAEQRPVNDVVKCALSVDYPATYLATLNTPNPRYILNSQDRWGYFTTKLSENDLHNKHLAFDWGAAAWSLQEVTFPTGGSTRFSYVPKKFSAINDIELQDFGIALLSGGDTSEGRIGGGVRAGAITHCDGLDDCYSKVYETVESVKYDVTTSSGVVGSIPQYPEHTGFYTSADRVYPESEDLLFYESFEGNNPSVTYAESYAKMGFSNPVDTGYVRTSYYTLKDNPAEGKYIPEKIFPLYMWGTSGSGEGNAAGNPDTSAGQGFVGLSNFEFNQKYSNVEAASSEYYNGLYFKENTPYYVMTSEPGYLFFLNSNGGLANPGHNILDEDECDLRVREQHDLEQAPPLIYQSCPGYEEENFACGTVMFSNTGVSGHSDGGPDKCNDPGGILVFCPASTAEGTFGLIDATGSENDYNPYYDFSTTGDWSVATYLRHDGSDLGSPRWDFMPYYHNCRFVFGGPNGEGHFEQFWSSNEYVGFTEDGYGGCADMNNNNICDIEENDGFVAKEIKSSMLGLKKSTAVLVENDAWDELSDPNYIDQARTDYTYHEIDLGSFGGQHLGTTRLTMTQSISDCKDSNGNGLCNYGLTTKETFGTQEDGTYNAEDSGFDKWTGTPTRTVKYGNDGKKQITEVILAHQLRTEYGTFFEEAGIQDNPFAKNQLHTLIIPADTRIKDELDTEDTFISRSYNTFSRVWGSVFEPTSSRSANGAWLPKSTYVVEKLDGPDHLIKVSEVGDYDKFLQPVLTKDAANRPSLITYAADGYCWEGLTGNVYDNYVFEEPAATARYNYALPSCVENHAGHRVKTYYDDLGRVSKTEDPNGLITRYFYDEYSRLQEVTGVGAENLMPHSNMDVDYDGNGVPDGWTASAQGSHSLVAGKSGNGLLISRQNVDGGTSMVHAYSKKMSLDAGQPYTASVWAKAQPGDQMKIFFGDTCGGSPFVWSGEQTVTATGEWQRLSVTRTPVANNRAGCNDLTTGYVYLYAPTNGDIVTYDQVQVEPGSEASPYNGPLTYYHYNFGLDTCDALSTDDVSCMNWVRTDTVIDEGVIGSAIAYADGLGRSLQSSVVKDANTAIASITEYNSKGLVDGVFEAVEVTADTVGATASAFDPLGFHGPRLLYPHSFEEVANYE